MNHKMSRGNSTLEFAFVLLLLVPMLLGTTVIGVNMIKAIQTIQLARDVGHMAARGVDFSRPGNQTLLVKIGENLGLTTSTTTSNAVVIISSVTYVDNATCLLGGCAKAADGTAIGCENKGLWVFTLRLTIGNPGVRGSDIGSPLTSGPTGVAIASDGTISITDYIHKAGAVATFTGINPYTAAVGATAASGLPSGQVVWVSEAGAIGFSMQPFMPNARSYSYGMF